MAVDRKYGRITLQHGNVGDDEPVVVFRAQDKLLPKLLAYYHLFCLKEGSPRRHLDIILNTKETVEEWQNSNFSKVRTPNSKSSIDRLKS